jgi:hypothetical protein
MQQNRVFNMLPHPHPIRSNMALRMRMRQNRTLLILTDTEMKPKLENKTAKQPKHEVREFKRPHPHKEHKTDQQKTKLKQQTLHSTTPTLTKLKNRTY